LQQDRQRQGYKLWVNQYNFCQCKLFFIIRPIQTFSEVFSSSRFLQYA